MALWGRVASTPSPETSCLKHVIVHTHTTIQQLQAHAENREKATKGSSSIVNISKLRETQKGRLQGPASTLKQGASCLLQLNQPKKIKEKQFGRGQLKRISACTLVFRLLGCEHKLTVAKKDFTGFFSETRPDCPKRWQSSGPSLANKTLNVSGGGSRYNMALAGIQVPSKKP